MYKYFTTEFLIINQHTCYCLLLKRPICCWTVTCLGGFGVLWDSGGGCLLGNLSRASLAFAYLSLTVRRVTTRPSDQRCSLQNREKILTTRCSCTLYMYNLHVALNIKLTKSLIIFNFLRNTFSFSALWI